MEQAAVAVAALRRILLEPQNGPARGQPQQRAERAKGTAPEAGHHQVGQQERRQDQGQQEGLLEMRRTEGPAVERGQYGSAQGADQNGNGIKGQEQRDPA